MESWLRGGLEGNGLVIAQVSLGESSDFHSALRTGVRQINHLQV